jgi:hypothetical protein
MPKQEEEEEGGGGGDFFNTISAQFCWGFWTIFLLSTNIYCHRAVTAQSV